MDEFLKEQEKFNKQKKSPVVPLLIAVLLFVICNFAGMLIFAFMWKEDKREEENFEYADNVFNEETVTENRNEEPTEPEAGRTEAELKELMKAAMESGEGVMPFLRRVYPEYVVVYQNQAYKFIPVNEKLAQNKILQENIHVLEDGELQYVKDGTVVSKKGVDVSKYQGEIDWQKVAADGVKFAMLRLGYRGYGTGALVLDESFDKNIQEARKAGIKVGVYFFSQAISEEEAREEANFVIEHLKPYELEYPVVFDTEEITNDDGRMEGMTPDEITDAAIAFCDTVEAAGYKPMVYANLRWFTMSMNMERLEKYDKWYAYYDKEYYFPYKVDMWQYTDSGQVDGINGAVDMNIEISYEEQ